LEELRRQIDAARGKTAADSYVSCIERYFLPYFQDMQLEEISHTDIVEFEIWRNRQMGKQPKASTLNNFASAWSRLTQTAVNRGWISDAVPVPKLSTRGEKSQPCPAFNRAETERLLAYMVEWEKQGRFAVEREQRKKYLRWWVSGKTGGRWLIAKHRAAEPLQQLHQRQRDINTIAWDDLFTQGIPHRVFRFSTGYQPPSLNGTFRRLMRDSGLAKSLSGQNRTLYSLRHTYATLELLDGTDIHTLSKQMGNSAAIIERHYSKLTATLAAERLA
jgi:integrase